MLKARLYKYLGRFVFPNKGVTHIKRSPKLIVSLTSYPVRIHVVEQTIESILRQSLKPDAVILWLADSQFPNKEGSLPKTLVRYKKHGLQIRWCEDIKSYKKLIPALKEFPDDIIVTADDDVIYQEDWLEVLYKSYLRNPKSVHCHHMFTYQVASGYNIRGIDIVKENCVAEKNQVAIGIGGILYPPHILYKDVTKVDVFTQLAPTNDDVWFWAMTHIQGCEITLVQDFSRNIICIDDTQSSGLSNTINTMNEISIQFRRVLEVYPMLKQYVTINV